MDQFRMLPLVRLPDGPLAVWYNDSSIRDGRLRWIGDRLNSMAAIDNAHLDHAVVVYVDGAVAWFAPGHMHYLGQRAVLPDLAPRPSAFQIAAHIHQRCSALRSLSAAMRELAEPASIEIFT